MNPQIQKPPTPWPLIFLFLIIMGFAGIAGVVYYNYQKDNLLTGQLQELSAISDLKIRQITQWRFDRLDDARFLGGNIILGHDIPDYLEDTLNNYSDVLIRQILKSLTENYDYRSARLLDRDGEVMMAFPSYDDSDLESVEKLLPDIAAGRKPVLTDIYGDKNTEPVNLDLIIPLFSNKPGDTLTRGFILLRIDPDKFLFPLLRSWPTPSRSAETLIARKIGNEIVYLNKPGFFPASESISGKSGSSDRLPAAMAFRGIKGTIDGLDERNVRVVASMKKIPGTQWYLIAKVDREEVYSVLNSQMRLVITALVFFIATVGLFLGFILWMQRVRFYREKYEDELNRLALFKHFDYILKFANDIILLLDRDLRIVEANDRTLEAYLYRREEIIGRNFLDLQAQGTLPEMQRQIGRIDENGTATFETVHRRKDDFVFPVEISSRAVNIEGTLYYQIIGRDITERKQAEETLRESELRFRKIFEESPFPMVITGKDFAIMRANSAFCHMTGYEEGELRLHTFSELSHPDDSADDPLNLMKLIAEDIPVYNKEKRYIRKDGSVILGASTISIIRNNRDEADYFIGMVEDITLRKQAETELEKSFSLIKATLESTEDGILVVDNQGKIVQFNNKFLTMWNIPDEIIQRGSDKEALNFVKGQLLRPESFIENVRKLYDDPESTSSDLLEFRDGRFFERYSQAQKINNRSVGRVWSFRDITQKKRAEAELIAAKLKAEESDRLKTAFLHNVSHEIRTPMNAIIGFTSLLNEPDITAGERKQFTEIIAQSSNQLLSIINDIVDVANIESGQVKVHMAKTDLNHSLRSLHEQYGISEKQNNITIRLSAGLPDENASISTDNTKLIQIISNLVNNAVKFTKQGTIDFGYTLKGDFLEFFVRDTGIGIPPESLGKIFDRFYQVDRTISRQFGGTGLGLSICKAYVELLGGEISVDSEPAKGTVFQFTIPYLPVE